MTEFLHTPMFGIFLTCLSWTIGVWTQKKTGWKLCYPLVVATVFAIGVLTLLKIPYSAYKVGGDIVTTMLAPATAVLALNIYNQRKLLGKYFLPVVVGCSVGALTSLVTITLLCKLMAVNSVITASLFPKSVTTAIAVAISENRGGVAGITTAAVLMAGTTGALGAPLFAKIFRVKNPVAEGVAIGACSHALGTTKALEIGKLQGAMSSIAICICGIMTSVFVMFF